MGILGLKRNRSVARAAANLIPSGYGAMTVDSNADGVVDGFAKQDSSATSIYALDGGQKITLASVIATNAYGRIRLVSGFAVSPSTSYTLSCDAALTRSSAETVELIVLWYDAGDVSVGYNQKTGINPGTSYSRQTVTAVSPSTAAKALVITAIRASAIGDTGSAWFKDALFQPA
jgi:hypothetical protein